MAMYCPRCSSPAVEGQRFCRNCGMNMGLILDAMEGKQRGPLDFETLKSDLRDLGSSLRAGFEQASASFKNTKRLDKNPPAQTYAGHPQQAYPADFSQQINNSISLGVQKEVNKALGKVRAANSRKYSLQKAALSMFGGGAFMAVWYQLLHAAANSGLLASIEQTIRDRGDVPITGLVPVFQLFWLLGLIPIAKGVAHLINGIFFAPKALPQETPAETHGYVYPPVYPSPVSAVPPASSTPISGVSPASHIAGSTTNELNEKAAAQQSSVTEDATLRFEEAHRRP